MDYLKKLKNINIPRHLAIILDGNGRWAKKRNMPRIKGHAVGVETLREAIRFCFDANVYVLSVYAFSTENWKRPKEEVDFLFSLVEQYFKKHSDYFIERDIKVIISGDYSKLPESVVKVCNQIIEKTKDCKSGVFNICLNYGSHAEIIKAVREIAADVKENKIDISEINEQLFENHLYTKGLPPVDFLIRTSHEQRLSNYMLYQVAYAEFYFPKIFWPSFHKRNLYKAFKIYSKRNRRYGDIK